MNLRLLFPTCAVALSFIAGCGSRTTLTTTGAKHPSRGEHCEFQLLTTVPASGYTEIGVVDYQPKTNMDKTYTNLAEFKQEIEPYVCQAGGDAAIAAANGLGWYIKATVLKSTGTLTSASAPATAPAEATTPQQAPPACQADTQCKGDRICVSGQCVDPATKK